MLFNCFLDSGGILDYNIVDVILWYFEVICVYYEVIEDDKLLVELFLVLVEIIDWYCWGICYNI